jgi:MarR family transcriptional regulator, organic hydroperoxide resistance regulator
MQPESDSRRPADPVRRSLDAFRAIVRALRTTAATTERQFGISTAQLDAIEWLTDGPCESIQELAERTRTHPTSVTDVVQHLAARGLVNCEPHPIDKRRKRIILTDAGRAVMAAAPPTVWRQLRTGLETMMTEDQQALAELLVRWSAPLGDAEASQTE